MMNILDQILAQKRVEVARLDQAALRREAAASPRPLDFFAALEPGENGFPALIAELKRGSPSKGVFATHLDLIEVADVYAQNGAAAISVLTDREFFQGSLATLTRLRREINVPLPLLRKDFIICEAQIFEARAAGADAVLLIAAALPDDGLLRDLHAAALGLNLTPLVEVHNEDELVRVLKVPGVRLVGINNRDLGTFAVTLQTTARLRPLFPAGIRVVSESGIFSAADCHQLAALGVDATLVGEALVTSADIAAKTRELSGTHPSVVKEHGK